MGSGSRPLKAEKFPHPPGLLAVHISFSTPSPTTSRSLSSQTRRLDCVEGVCTKAIHRVPLRFSEPLSTHPTSGNVIPSPRAPVYKRGHVDIQSENFAWMSASRWRASMPIFEETGIGTMHSAAWGENFAW